MILEAQELADVMGVKIFIADNLSFFYQFKAHTDNLKEEKKREATNEAIFPCVLKIQAKGSFNNKDPIILGVNVLEGIVKVHFFLLFLFFVFGFWIKFTSSIFTCPIYDNLCSSNL